jgi:predicted ATP-grasp superfamily ATP-dependent carboligase|tara:strand:+ start:562 stop:783 length:222 start_codon:yes stop_codon:yes gene_type:complete
MKESKLIEMWNRIEILGTNVQQLIQEMNNLRDLSIGTMSLVKKFDGYEKALEDLQKDISKEMKNKKEKVDVEQ